MPAELESPSYELLAAAAKGTMISVATTVYGKALVVGSGPFAGFSLYSITSDHGHQFGCTATPVKTIAGRLLCTGPSTDHKAEWPAITTVGFAGDQRWTLGRIKTLIGKLFHVGYTVEGTRKLMRRHGWSRQVPVRRALERDEDAVTVWKAGVWPRIKVLRATWAPSSASRTRQARG